jgi:hypothetical protein
MSDDKDKQSEEADKPNAEADKPGAEAEKPGAEAAKPSAEAEKPGAEADKLSSAADKPGAEADKSSPAPGIASTTAGKPGAKAEKRSTKEKVLIGAVVLAALGLFWAVFHVFEVVREAQNPYSQSTRPVSQFKPASEAELEREEQKFQPKSVLPIPKDSAVMHEHLHVPAKKVETKAPQSHPAK